MTRHSGHAPQPRHDGRSGVRRWPRWPRWALVLVGAAFVAAHAIALRHAWARVAASGVAVSGGVLALVVAKHLGLVAAWRGQRRRPRP